VISVSVISPEDGGCISLLITDLLITDYFHLVVAFRYNQRHDERCDRDKR
jgi:hypothetical protein